MTTFSINTEVLIAELTQIDPRVSQSDAVCLALRALGHETLATRYATAAARMTYWLNKPSFTEFAGTSFGDPADKWTDAECVAHERDQEAYWAIVADIRVAVPVAEKD